MTGFNVSENGHVVNLIPPVDGNAGAPVTCTRFSMKNYNHASIIIQLGVTAGTPTSILVAAYTLASGGTRTAIAFRSYSQTTAGASNDVLSGPTNNAATGITSVSANDNIFYTIEIDSAELDAVTEAAGSESPYVQLEITMPASSNLVSAVAVLSGSRYGYQGSATATA